MQQKGKAASALVGTPSVRWVRGQVLPATATALVATGGAKVARGEAALVHVQLITEDSRQVLVVAPANVQFRGDIDDASTDDLVRLDYLHEPGCAPAVLWLAVIWPAVLWPAVLWPADWLQIGSRTVANVLAD